VWEIDAGFLRLTRLIISRVPCASEHRCAERLKTCERQGVLWQAATAVTETCREIGFICFDEAQLWHAPTKGPFIATQLNSSWVELCPYKWALTPSATFACEKAFCCDVFFVATRSNTSVILWVIRCRLEAAFDWHLQSIVNFTVMRGANVLNVHLPRKELANYQSLKRPRLPLAFSNPLQFLCTRRRLLCWRLLRQRCIPASLAQFERDFSS